MKTLLSSALLTISLILCNLSSRAQFAGLYVEVDTVLYGNYYDTFAGDSIDFTGYIVYQVYACFEDQGNCLIGVNGGASDAFSDILCGNPEDTDNLIINFDGNLFNSNVGAVFGENFNCAFCALSPIACWDSYLSVGADCLADGGSVFNVQLPCESAEWGQVFSGTNPLEPFEPGGQLYIDNGAWFTVAGGSNPNAIAGSDLKVLIAQFTTDLGFSIEGCIAFQQVCATGEDVVNTCFDLQVFENPCLANPMDTVLSTFIPPCFGGATGIVLDDGGNGPVDYQLHNCSNNAILDSWINEADGLTIDGLGEGDYFVTMIDSLGCRDTSNCVTIVIPDELFLTAEITTDIPCFGDLGTIATSCVGGTGQVDVDYNGPGANDGTVLCGSDIVDVPTGTYTLTATDVEGCSKDTVITFANPAELVINIEQTDISCYQFSDGALTGTITGGTGTIDAQWSGPNTDAFSGPSALTVTITSLDDGIYVLSATDENGCPIDSSFTLEEPVVLSVTTEHSDASCPGVCDGEVTATAEGGTGTLDVEITGGSFDDLCPDEYIVTVTDINQCTVTDTINIVSPTEVVYEFNSTNLSCFGLCDGSISLTNVTGGCGDYEFTLSPAAGTPDIGADYATFTDLCSGLYDLQITDACGCGITISDINITQPGELAIITENVQIDCFGAGNGSIEVSYSGGTGTVNLTEPVLQALPFTLDNLIPDTYHLVITDATGCMDSTDVIIAEPAQLITAIDQVNPVGCGGDCDGEVLIDYSGGTPGYDYSILDANDPETVLWDGQLDDTGNDFVGNLCAGDFLFVVSDDNGCSPDSLPFTIEEPDPIVVNVNEDWITCTGMCDGSAVILFTGGTGELSAQFFPEELTPSCAIGACTLVDLCEGTYSVTVTDEEDCQVDTTIFIGAEIVTDMILTMFSTPETCWNEIDGTATVAIQNGNEPISVVWDDPAEQTTMTAVGLASNEIYTVTVTDAIGCTLTEQVEVAPTIGCFFIATALTPNGDGINDEWLLGGFEYFPTATIQVFNRWGQVMFESRGYQVAWDGTFKGEKLPTADYYFVINYSDELDPIMGTVTIKY